MLNYLPQIMIFCLANTIIIELIIAYILKIRNKKDFINIVLVNIVTNPIVSSIPYIIYLFFGIMYRIISLIILEIWAFVTEGLIYKKYLNYKKINHFILSLILNLSSYTFGVIIDLVI